MIQVHWEILEEEGRVVKAVVDIAGLDCKYVEKNSRPKIADKMSDPYRTSSVPSDTTIVDSLGSLRALSQKIDRLKPFFGETTQQKASIQAFLLNYDQQIKKAMNMPILQYSKDQKFPLPRELLVSKRTQMLQAVKRIQEMMVVKQTKYLCGNQLTVADLILYFDVLNLAYLRLSHSGYPSLMAWFGQVYKIGRVKALTHQWFSMAKQITRSLRIPKDQARL